MSLASDIAAAVSGIFLTTRIDLKQVRLEVPGIAAADALDANDTFGTVMEFPGAARTNGGTGVITKAIFHDYDDEGIAKTLYLFSRPPVLAASDVAWALVDDDLRYLVGKISFTSFDDHTNCQASVVAPALYYACAARATSLWGGLQTSGADNIAAGSMPEITLLMARD